MLSYSFICLMAHTYGAFFAHRNEEEVKKLSAKAPQSKYAYQSWSSVEVANIRKILEYPEDFDILGGVLDQVE